MYRKRVLNLAIAWIAIAALLLAAVIMVSPAASQGELVDVVQDGGFEAGSPNPFWNEASTNFGTPLCTTALCGFGGGTGPHSGTWWSWFGGTTSLETGSVDQDVTIPVGTATLSFWLEIPSADTTGFMTVGIDGNVLATYTEADAGAYATYQQVTMDVSAYADGGLHNLAFNSTTQPGTGVLNFFIDDVVLDVVAAPAAITMDKTVGTTQGVCATTDSITIPTGSGPTDVYYCYEMTNTGGVTVTYHTLVDSELGTLLGPDFVLDIGPGQSIDTVTAGLEISATVTASVTNTATWTITDDQGGQIIAQATDSAQVIWETPTDVSLSGFEATSSNQLWLLLLAGGLVIGLGLVVRRKVTA